MITQPLFFHLEDLFSSIVIFFFFSLHTSLWENYLFTSNPYIDLFYNNYNSFFRVLANFNNNLLHQNKNFSFDYSFFNSVFFENQHYESLIFTDSYTPVIQKGLNLHTDKLYLRFPKRSVRFLMTEHILSDFHNFSEYYFPKTYNKQSNIFGKLYNTNQMLYTEPQFNKHSEINKWLLSYFEFFNNKVNIQNTSVDCTVPKFCYYISSLQMAHILKLTYNEIQIILYFLKNDPYFSGCNFFDVHFSLYSTSNQIFFSSTYHNSDISSSFVVKSFNNHFLSSYSKYGFFNPFELFFKNEFLLKYISKKYYFDENDLCLLPFHILLSVGVHTTSNQFFINDFLENSRSNFFINFFFSNGLYYSQRLFQYQQYSIYARTALLGFLTDSFVYKLPYQRFDISLENPWWESLSDISRQKLLLIFQNLSFQDTHLLLSHAVTRHLNGFSFYTNAELMEIFSQKADRNTVFGFNNVLESKTGFLNLHYFLFYFFSFYDQMFNDYFFNCYTIIEPSNFSFNFINYNMNNTFSITDLLLLENGAVKEYKFVSFFFFTKFFFYYFYSDFLDIYFKVFMFDTSFLFEMYRYSLNLPLYSTSNEFLNRYTIQNLKDLFLRNVIDLQFDYLSSSYKKFIISCLIAFY